MGEQGKSSRYFLLSIVLVGAVSFHSLTLMRFPRPFVDEVWNLARASGFLESGWAFGPLDEGVFEEFPGHKRFFPWLPTAIQSLVYWWSDTPALGPLRVISLIAGFVVLGAIWKIAFDLKGFEVATLALWLTAFSFSFGVSTHLGRFDIFTAAFGYWAVALKLASPSTLARNFCSGLLSGLAVECHAHGAVFPFALLLFVALKDKASCLRDPTFWAFISGGIVTVVIYIGVHIGPYLDSYVAWNRLVFAPTHCPPLLAGRWDVFVEALYLGGTVLHEVLPYGLPIFLLLFHLRGHERPNRILLLLTSVLFLSFVLLVRHKCFYYQILISPILTLWFANGLNEAFRIPTRSFLATRSLQVIMVGYSVIHCSILLCQKFPNEQQFRETMSRIEQNVLPNDVIMGGQTYWLNLYKHKYYSWEQLIYYLRLYSGAPIAEAFFYFRPTIFILDSHIDSFLQSSTRDNTAVSPYISLPREQLLEFIARHGALLDEFDSGVYGRIRLYRLNYDQ